MTEKTGSTFELWTYYAITDNQDKEKKDIPIQSNQKSVSYRTHQIRNNYTQEMEATSTYEDNKQLDNNNNNNHLQPFFQDNPGELLPESYHFLVAALPD